MRVRGAANARLRRNNLIKRKEFRASLLGGNLLFVYRIFVANDKHRMQIGGVLGRLGKRLDERFVHDSGAGPSVLEVITIIVRRQK